MTIAQLRDKIFSLISFERKVRRLFISPAEPSLSSEGIPTYVDTAEYLPSGLVLRANDCFPRSFLSPTGSVTNDANGSNFNRLFLDWVSIEVSEYVIASQLYLQEIENWLSYRVGYSYSLISEDYLGLFVHLGNMQWEDQMQGYLLAAMALFRTLFIVGLISFVGRIAGTPFNAVSTAKVTPYECGFSPFEKLDRNQLFIFYRLAVFFIIFEAELIFLYPWVIRLRPNAHDNNFFYSALPLVLVLLVGFMYEIQRGALEL